MKLHAGDLVEVRCLQRIVTDNMRVMKACVALVVESSSAKCSGKVLADGCVVTDFIVIDILHRRHQHSG